jgi:hypothetical protein
MAFPQYVIVYAYACCIWTETPCSKCRISCPVSLVAAATTQKIQNSVAGHILFLRISYHILSISMPMPQKGYYILSLVAAATTQKIQSFRIVAKTNFLYFLQPKLQQSRLFRSWKLVKKSTTRCGCCIKTRTILIVVATLLSITCPSGEIEWTAKMFECTSVLENPCFMLYSQVFLFSTFC